MSTQFDESKVNRDHGKFAPKGYSDPGQLDLEVEVSTEELLRQHRPGLVTLYTPGPGDMLSDEQADMLLHGDRDGAWSDLEDSISGYKYERAWELSREWAENAGVNYDELSESEQDWMSDTLFENDESYALEELVKQDQPRMVRAPLASSDALDADALYAANTERDVDARVAKVAELLVANGAADADAHRAARELVEEGPEYWNSSLELNVVFQARVAEVAPNLDGDHTVSTRLHMRGAQVVLMDTATGSGSASTVENLSFDAPIGGPKSLRLDDPEDGSEDYNWTEVSSPHPAAYRPTELRRVDHRDPEIAVRNAQVAVVHARNIDNELVAAALESPDRSAKREAFAGLARTDENTHVTLAQGLAPHANVQHIEQAVSFARQAEERRNVESHPFDDTLVRQYHAMHARYPRTTIEAWDYRAQNAFESCLEADD